MPNYDKVCDTCGESHVDVMEPVSAAPVSCQCGGTLQRAWITKPSNVIGDEIDIWIENGLCWPDDSPRHFTSKIEIARAAKEANMFNTVEHIGRQGSDKSEHTTRWVSIPLVSEEQRKRDWHEHEVKAFGKDIDA